MKSIGWRIARSSRRRGTGKRAQGRKAIPARNGSRQFEARREAPLLHAEVLKQKLGLSCKRRRIALMHDPAGFQNIEAIRNRKRSIEVLLDQQDRQALALEIKHDPLQML